MIYELRGYLPVLVILRFAIRVKIVDLQEIKVAAIVLQEVTDELAHRALILRVNIHLREDFIKGVNRADSLWIRVGHTLDLIAVNVIVAINCKERLQRTLVILVMQFDVELRLDHFAVFGFTSNFRSFYSLHLFSINHALQLTLVLANLYAHIAVLSHVGRGSSPPCAIVNVFLRDSAHLLVKVSHGRRPGHLLFGLN